MPPEIKLDPSLVRKVQALNQAADQVGETIKSLDQQLADAGLGVEVWVDLYEEPFLGKCVDQGGDRDEPLKMTRETTVGYGRIGGNFTLAVRVSEGEDRGTYTHYIETKRYPLAGASRELRLDAEAKLPDLVKAIEEEVEARLEKRPAIHVTRTWPTQ